MDPQLRGRWLEKCRLEAGVSLRKAAAATGVTHPTILAWEHDEGKPDWTQLTAMARAYGCHIDELAGIDSTGVRSLPATWPEGLKEFIADEQSEIAKLQPREVLMLARAGWLNPRPRDPVAWRVVLAVLRRQRNENEDTGEGPPMKRVGIGPAEITALSGHVLEEIAEK